MFSSIPSIVHSGVPGIQISVTGSWQQGRGRTVTNWIVAENNLPTRQVTKINEKRRVEVDFQLGTTRSSTCVEAIAWIFPFDMILGHLRSGIVAFWLLLPLVLGVKFDLVAEKNPRPSMSPPSTFDRMCSADFLGWFVPSPIPGRRVVADRQYLEFCGSQLACDRHGQCTSFEWPEGGY